MTLLPECGLDPGIDLGHADPGLVEEIIGPRLDAEQWAAVQRAFGVRGTAASALADDLAAVLRGVVPSVRGPEQVRTPDQIVAEAV